MQSTLLNRRQFVWTTALLSACSVTGVQRSTGVAPLRADPEAILDLPEGFTYRVISTAGEPMSDGLLTPARPDGMAAFPAADGRIALVRNHENLASQNAYGAFGKQLERLSQLDKRFFYDYGKGEMPGTGGTTTLVVNPRSMQVEYSYLSLAGTELNCAGGPTPWNSWLSCEECFADEVIQLTSHFPREQLHGYVFEVDALAGRIQVPKKLPALGRFVHEAAAIETGTGTVYLTEDRRDGLLYRCIPNEPGKLERGGRLQALGFVDPDLKDTSNLADAEPQIPIGRWLPVRWIDMEGIDSDIDDLRQRGHEMGAARFVRGEGIWHRQGEICFACTEGGPDKVGQVFRYRSLADPDGDRGELMLMAEAEAGSPMHNADNLTFTPWGELMICEDRPSHCGLYLMRMDGELVHFAQHSASTSELAGVCFAPDGQTLFVNIQDAGLTLAIQGPFQQLRA